METRQCGPSGGTGGNEFVDEIGPQDYRIVEVHVHAQEQVNGIQIVHQTIDGRRHVFPLRGCAFGDCYILNLAADDFIISISGRYGRQVDTIHIQTNKQVSPTLAGMGSDSMYRYEAPSGAEIVGFCRRAADALDAVGLIFRQRGL
jgi:hypothetical protein